jgi:hypothetical protein
MPGSRMTDERLAEIERWVHGGLCSDMESETSLRNLLAEVARLTAERDEARRERDAATLAAFLAAADMESPAAWAVETIVQVMRRLADGQHLARREEVAEVYRWVSASLDRPGSGLAPASPPGDAAEEGWADGRS